MLSPIALSAVWTLQSYNRYLQTGTSEINQNKTSLEIITALYYRLSSVLVVVVVMYKLLVGFNVQYAVWSPTRAAHGKLFTVLPCRETECEKKRNKEQVKRKSLRPTCVLTLLHFCPKCAFCITDNACVGFLEKTIGKPCTGGGSGGVSRHPKP